MLEVYSDGSSGNRSGKPGGWAYVVVRDGKVIDTSYGGDPSTSNNRMEMKGAIEGLKAGRELRGKNVIEQITLCSDSEVTLKIANGQYQAAANQDLAAELRQLANDLLINFRHVRGHQLDRRKPWQTYNQDVLMNERCDSLAKLGKTMASQR